MLLALLLLFLLFILLAGLFFTLGMVVFKILYICCIGIPFAICFCVLGAALCITVIGIPFGKLFFKAAGFVLSPFG